VFLSLNDRDKPHAERLGKDLAALGFKLAATKGTAEILRSHGIEAAAMYKVGEGRPDVVDCMINGEVDWIINTPLGVDAKADETAIRRTAIERGLPIMTTVAAAKAAVQAIRAMREYPLAVQSLQEYHAGLKKA
jgi:carbamoyl-phosphate synthase large subunit